MNISGYIPSQGEKIRYFNSSSTQDGHGGRAKEHREEMRQIAQETVEMLAPAIAKKIYVETLQGMLDALRYDIETIVSISFDDAHDILTSKKVRKYVSDRITREVLKRIENMEIPGITIK